MKTNEPSPLDENKPAPSFNPKEEDGPMEFSGSLSMDEKREEWAASEAGELILRATGEDLNREGLRRTPERYGKAMLELTQGYFRTVEQAVGSGIFPAESQGHISVNGVEFYSLCEHHMLPFWGQMSVAYLPDKKILGLSKIPRIIEVFARRFQLQERLTDQVAQAIEDVIQPKAVAVSSKASHLCMMMRGVKKQQSQTLCEASRGVNKLSVDTRARLWKALEG